MAGQRNASAPSGSSDSEAFTRFATFASGGLSLPLARVEGLTNYYREYSARVNVHHGFGASDSNVSSTGLVVKCRDGHPSSQYCHTPSLNNYF